VKIYTRRGDAGETDLLGGGRVAKDDRRVQAYGDVDELNAGLGAAAAASPHADLRELVRGIQAALFSLGAELASPDGRRRERAAIPGIGEGDVEALEKRIDALASELAPLRRFILPGGTAAAAAFHVARTVCRRAERSAVALHRAEPLSPVVLRYLNRLSDLLFVLARVENRRAGIPDIEWEGRGA
jgi:cob(I)alamin adenosyltransferase